jgi:hypothetical protein
VSDPRFVSAPITPEVMALLAAQASEDGAHCGAHTMRLLVSAVHNLQEELRFWQGIKETDAPKQTTAEAWLKESPSRCISFTVIGAMFEATVGMPGRSGRDTDIAVGNGETLEEAFRKAREKL